VDRLQEAAFLKNEILDNRLLTKKIIKKEGKVQTQIDSMRAQPFDHMTTGEPWSTMTVPLMSITHKTIGGTAL
jgi:hypothetical protein